MPAGIFIVILTSVQCASQKKSAYNFPAEMSDQVRKDFTAQCDKGKILYEINCGGCHTKKVWGKSVIPDFRPEQLKGYELRITNSRHEASLTDEAVTAEELGLIMTFLSYKKQK
ncbi:MAG: hypothetical protein ACJ75J_10260 [Cytophagaceae bacterium]